MPTWGEILIEVQQSAAIRGPLGPGWDSIRRKYLTRLHALTRHDTILYATSWLTEGKPGNTSITLGDMQGLMEVSVGLRGPNLDVILHSPGGTAEATASIVRYLRRRFSYIRVFVPLAAMSAATMWALAGNRIVMGKHSQLGPIDPQVVIGQTFVPTRAVINEFERAKKEIAADPSVLGAWLPRLQQYPPGLLTQCESAEELATRLVGEWLEAYMFQGVHDAADKARAAASYFSQYETHHSHNLGIDRDQARSVGVHVDDLESSPDLQDAVLSVHHATMHTFSGPAFKVIENQLGKAYVQSAQQMQINMPMMIPQPLAPPGSPPS